MAPNSDNLFCHDLPSQPRPELGPVVVTGATGYVGGRLVDELMARGYRVRVMVRAGSDEHIRRWPNAQLAVADALNVDRLSAALQGASVAYYLIHSLLLGREEFEAADIQAARNFRTAAEAAGLQRIIYLGGLGEVGSPLSRHLRSRAMVARELTAGATPVTVLRTAIIIGSGSASYEIIEHLVKNVPVLPIPHWARTRCQPIGIRDVIKYLVGVLESPETAGRSFDIGGKDVLTYKEMMQTLARLLGRRRLFVPCPFSNIALFAYMAGLFTPVPSQITRCLMEGIVNTVVCQHTDIRDVLDFEPLSYREAIVRAMSRAEQDQVSTRWSDAYPPAHELAMRLEEIEDPIRYTSSASLLTDKDPADLFRSVCRIGGRKGWFYGNWLWRLRGMIDRMLLGVGSARGRRSSSTLRVGDVIDFFRVEDIRPDSMLLLRAEMKIGGRAWLQFSIDEQPGMNRFSVNAFYQPRNVFGRIYWFICLPLHHFVFHSLIRQIEKRS